MTEHEWLTSDDPGAMMDHLRYQSYEITEYGLGTVTQSRHPPLITDQQSRLWVEACRAEFDRTRGKVIAGVPWAEFSQDAVDVWTGQRSLLPGDLRAALLREVVGNPFRPVKLCSGRQFKCWLCGGYGRAYDVDGIGAGGVIVGAGGVIVGMPRDFVCLCCKGSGSQNHDTTEKPCSACNTSLTPKIHNMAQAIHDRGQFEPWEMGALADELEEAGCGEEELLRHLRGEERAVCNRCEGDGLASGADRPFEWHAGADYMKCPVCNGGGIDGWKPLNCPHVRGCWAIELLRGSE